MLSTRWPRRALAPARTPARAPRLSVEALEARDNPSGGILDPTFGNGGIAAPVTAPNEDMYGVAVQPDGRILSVGGIAASTQNFLLTRTNPDGTPDATFGVGGRVTTDFNNAADRAYAVAVQPGTGGKILVAGYAMAPTQKTKGKGSTTLDYAFGVARYNPNGTLDTTFGSGGKAIADFAGTSDYGYALATLPDGRFVVAGMTGTNIGLARFLANGSLDTSFGTGGRVVGPAAGGDGNGYMRRVSLTVDGSGRLVVGSSTRTVYSVENNDFLVARFLASGQPDASFGTAGVVRTDVAPGLDDGVSAVTVQPDGRILVGGAAQYVTTNNGETIYPPLFALVRYNPDGTLDGGFGTGGVVTAVPDLSRLSAGAVAGVAVRPDGSILVGGQLNYPGQYGTAVLRFDAAGNRDLSFGTPGAGGAVTMVPGLAISVKDMAVDSGGRVLLAGNSNVSDPVLVRYLVSAPSVGSFTGSASTVAAGDAVTLTASGVTPGNPGGSVTRVEFYYFDGSGAKQLLGTGTLVSAGVWEMTFTVALAPGPYTLFAEATDSYGAVSDPLSLSLQVV